MRPPPLWSDPVLLDRYLSGEATPGESSAIEQWLAANPEERRVLDAVRAGVADPYGPVPTYDANVRAAAIVDYSVRAVRRMRRQPDTVGVSSVSRRFMRVGRREMPTKMTGPTLRGIRVLGTQPLRRGGGREQPSSWKRWPVLVGIGVGLGVIMAVLVLAATWRAGLDSLKGHTATSMLTYATGNGERATITLPDGGTVALNVASRLQVPLDYMAGDHTVRLIGEGLFTVPHYAHKPFTVRAGTTTTRVLGTSFVVRAYATDTAALVAVRDGKVAVGVTVVPAGHRVNVGRDGVARLQMANGSEFSFATGVLTLDGIPLPDAIVELDRWYDADIRVGSPALATQYVKGRFGTGSLNDLDEILGLAFGVRVVRSGRVLTLYLK